MLPYFAERAMFYTWLLPAAVRCAIFAAIIVYVFRHMPQTIRQYRHKVIRHALILMMLLLMPALPPLYALQLLIAP